MLEQEKDRKIPKVEFTFMDEPQTEEERKREIEELLRKRNEILDSMGISISSSSEEQINDFSRQSGNNRIDISDKMKSGIIGFAIGDALGVPVEFLKRELLQRKPIKDMLGYGTYNVPEGTWSDDTSLTIAAMDSIKEQGDIDFNDIMSKFTEWADYAKYTATDELFDIGISTRRAISNFKSGETATNCGPSGIRDNGNGSLMRILPFACYLKLSNLNDEEKTEVINQASSLTHAHEISKLGCKIYSDYIELLLDGIDKTEALKQLKEKDYNKYYSEKSINEYKRILEGDLKSIDINQIKSSGYVVDSLEASLWCTLTNGTYEEAVITAVNLGDDTDTIGAITGSINGIIYGKENIPTRWLEKLKKKEYLENLSSEFISTINHEKKVEIYEY